MTTRLAPKPPEIGDLDGFDKHDLFQAKRMGERLADIICDLEGPAVIAIDGSWGTGKTTFVRQWAGMLRQRRHPVVYFDAFEHDHLDDPFMALFTHLLKASATPDEPILTTRRDRLIRAVTPILKPALGSVADAALHRASLGLVDPQDIRERIDSANEKEPSDPTAVVAEAVKQIEQQAGRVDAFRETLSNCVAELGQSGEADTGSDVVAPLIFIVDELDRCRPSYALSLLERIKHVFSTHNVCFVLVTNVDSLAAMAEKTYGFKNGREYLQKFYHRRIDITSLLRRETPAGAYMDHLAAGLGIDRTSGRYDRIVLDNLIRVHDVSLRGQERIMASFGLLYDRASLSQYQIMAASLCVMRLIRPDLFAAAKKGAISYAQTKQFLRIDNRWLAADEVVGCWREFAGEVAEDGLYSWGRWGASEEEYRRGIAVICDTIELFQSREG
jgi:hypothetical protein